MQAAATDVHSQFSIMGMWNSMTPLGKGVVIVLLIMSAWSLTMFGLLRDLAGRYLARR